MRISFSAAIALSLLFITNISWASTESEPADAQGTSSISAAYREKAELIIKTVLAENEAYLKMQELCDDIGHRLAGSVQLEQAISWASARLKSDGMKNVHTEPVEVPHWVRGKESLLMTEPYQASLPMLGLGFSEGTSAEGITAEVVVVRDEKELQKLGDSVQGKIVLFNFPMRPYSKEHGSGYGEAVRFRSSGARWASAQGAVACLIRSVTDHSLNTPHTGMMHYGDAPNKIPAAAITVEDAEKLARLQARGKKISVTLQMEARNLPPAMSANVVAELRGSTQPDEVVVIGGHIDSWDVGQGAHDDGGGCVIAMEAVNVLQKLNLIPRRTIRVVLWTGEEVGLCGGQAYAKAHADELDKHVAAIESDIGIFEPTGYGVDCADKERATIALGQLSDIANLLKPLGADSISAGWSGPDIGPMKPGGVVVMGHRTEASRYFYYHHSPADTLDKIDPEILSKNVAALTTMAYIIADMPQRLGGPTKLSGVPTNLGSQIK